MERGRKVGGRGKEVRVRWGEQGGERRKRREGRGRYGESR